MDRPWAWATKRWRRVNPRIVYCAYHRLRPGWAQGAVAAHDLNYLAESGLLGLAAAPMGRRWCQTGADRRIAGGLTRRRSTSCWRCANARLSGRGCKLDIAMADDLFTFMYWALGNGLAAGAWPSPGGDLVTGGSPRYQIYRTQDGKFLAAAPLEQKFWDNFCDAIRLDAQCRDDARDPGAGTWSAVAASSRRGCGRVGRDVCRQGRLLRLS